MVLLFSLRETSHMCHFWKIFINQL